jgi:hypothetical protein
LPGRRWEEARIFWRADWNASVLAVEALPASQNDPDAFNIRRFEHLATVLRRADGTEHLLLSDGQRRLQLDIIAGSVLAGPVRFRCVLADSSKIEAKLLTLRRLILLSRLGRFPRGLYRPESRARRWAMALQAYDGRREDAGHRDIAGALFGDKMVQDDWSGRSDYLRSRVQRLLRTANSLVDGGYRALLQGRGRRQAEGEDGDEIS